MGMKRKKSIIIALALVIGVVGTMGWRIVNRPKPSEAVSISAIREVRGMPVTEYVVATSPWEYWLPLYGTVRTSGLSEVYASQAEYVTSLSAEVGDVVAKGQLLATLDSRKAAEKVQAARAKYNELSMKYERVQELQKAGGYSVQEVESVFSQYKDAGASLQQLETELTRHKVVSPIAGVVIRRDAEIGLLAGASKPLFVIGDPKRFEITIDLSPRYIGTVRDGMPARYRADAVSSWDSASVKRVDPMANSVTGLYTVVLALGNPPKALHIGALVEAQIMIERMVESTEFVVVVPYESVNETEGVARVYVCSDDVAVERVVERGRTDDRGMTRILSGLSPGEKIVMKGADRMYNGAKIWIQ